ncbi:hypothetical protein LG299_04110 [Microbacterium lacus]|uniref:hypothetical protein n=1 Tax=Microbacterium lacus TaxID=415217 RepID=UPI00384C39F2
MHATPLGGCIEPRVPNAGLPLAFLDVDEPADFDLLYNTRPTKASPAGSPRRRHGRDTEDRPTPAHHPVSPAAGARRRDPLKKVADSGVVEFRGIRFGIGRAWGDQRVWVMEAGKTVNDLRPARHAHGAVAGS